MNGTGGPLHVGGRKEGGAKDGCRRPIYKEEGTDLPDPEVGMQGEEQVWMKKRSDGLKPRVFDAEVQGRGHENRRQSEEGNGGPRSEWM